MAKCKYGAGAATIAVGGRGFGGVNVTRQLIRGVAANPRAYTPAQRAAVRRVGGIAGFNRRARAGQSTMR